jgi:hypothetical protein
VGSEWGTIAGGGHVFASRGVRAEGTLEEEPDAIDPLSGCSLQNPHAFEKGNLFNRIGFYATFKEGDSYAHIEPHAAFNASEGDAIDG